MRAAAYLRYSAQTNLPAPGVIHDEEERVKMSSGSAARNAKIPSRTQGQRQKKKLNFISYMPASAASFCACS